MQVSFWRFTFLTLLNVLLLQQGFSQTDIASYASQYIRQHKLQLGVNKDVSWRIADITGGIQGIAHVYLQQTHGDIDIDGSIVSLHFKNGEVIHTAGSFISKIVQLTPTTNPIVSSTAALKTALNRLELRSSLPLISSSTLVDAAQTSYFDLGDIARQTVSAKLIYTQYGTRDIRLSWEINLYEKTRFKSWIVRVDANSGEVLRVHDQVLRCEFDKADACHSTHLHEMTTSSSTASSSSALANTYTVLPLTVESPSHGNFTTVTNPASDNTTASPLGWHADATNNYSYTQGNNVLAREDRDADNTGGQVANGGASLDFNFVFDPNLQPHEGDNLNAAITNLFYWNNIMHDIFYNYGFDEASGNFQAYNFGRGGAENDLIVAEAQDGADVSNANFLAPPDGQLGVMQMFLWSAPGSSSNFTVHSPASIASSYPFVLAQFGANNFSVTGDLVFVDDGSANPTEGCVAATNSTDLMGNIAMVDRGNCEFGIKVLNAENAGAIAAIVCNNIASNPVAMAPGVNGGSVTIPAVMISQADCATIRAEVPGTNVTLFNLLMQIDGDFDNSIVAHEYGHGISIRLTGGASNAACLNNSEQMGEGWSDFFALTVTNLPSYTANTARGLGTYAVSQPPTAGGIRPYPYTHDMSVNPITYADVGNTIFSEPHGIGSIWCTMLWDLYWDLINDYGYDTDLYNGTGGNNIAMRLVTEACKFQACSPGFVDGRDAILAADRAIYGGVNQCTIWESFARRGLGFSADQGSSNDRFDGIEAFDIPPPSLLGVQFGKIADQSAVNCGDVVNFTIIATPAVNLDCIPKATNVVIRDSLPAGLNYVNGSASNGGTESGGIITWPIIPTFDTNQSYNYQATVDCNTFAIPNFNAVFDDDTENGVPSLISTTNLANLSNWQITNSQASSGSSSWYAEELEATPENAEEQYLVIGPIQLIGNSEMSFQHLFDTESFWDGGRVEISLDDGQTWDDLGNDMTQNPYNSYLANDPSFPGFSGLSNGNASWMQTQIDLSNYASCNIYIRFNFYYDVLAVGNAANGVNDGWYIDDISITTSAANYLINRASISGEGDIRNTMACIELNTIAVNLKTMLRGAYTSGALMDAKLNALTLIPTTEPYTNLGYTHINGGGGESITSTALNAIGADAIVDWVVVELRDSNTPATILATRSALLTASGDVVDMDGKSSVSFFMPSGNYYVAIRHRNHLGVMTATSVLLN